MTKPEAVKGQLCRQGDSEGALMTIAMELADADPHAALSTALVLLKGLVGCRLYYPGAYLSEQTRDLTKAADAALRKGHLICFGTGLLDFKGRSGSRYQDDPSFVRGLFRA